MGKRFEVYYVWMCMAVLFMSSGCSKQSDPVNFVNIEDQYELKLHQSLTENGGLPSLQINSLREQECTNSFISHNVDNSDEKIEVFLYDILTEGDCIPGSVIVSEEISLSTPNSAIPIEIILKDAVRNKGTLYTDKSEFELVLNEFDGLKISRTHLNRVRPNMLWGSFNLSDNAINVNIRQYLNSIDNHIDELKGDYGYFYLAQDESIEVYNQDHPVTFLISTDESIENIIATIQEFKVSDPSLVFQATNYDGFTMNIH